MSQALSWWTESEKASAHTECTQYPVETQEQLISLPNAQCDTEGCTSAMGAEGRATGWIVWGFLELSLKVLVMRNYTIGLHTLG